jgi:TonB-dependent SusC/RagA subfamily outer membrane receptor
MRASDVGAVLILCCAGPLRGQRDVRADSIVPTAPIATLSDVLTVRAPGVQVESRDGSAGAGPVITIRGTAEPTTIPTPPLLFIDGIRVDNTQGADNSRAAGHAAPARFDDIDPADIERIEILPGAATAALYGPGAGNGVVLVTTRRGRDRLISGRMTVESGVTTMPPFEQPSYYAWGHTPSGPQQCLTYQRASGACVVDSVTHFNPLLDDATRPFTWGTERRFGAEVGASVSGLRAFVTGHYADETGDLQMPNPDIMVYEFQASGHGRVPTTYFRPSAADRADVRAQVSSDIGRTIDWGIAASYGGVHQRTTSTDSLLLGAAAGPGARQSEDGWYPPDRPGVLFTDVATERIRQRTASAHGNWRPLSGLTLHALAGSDAIDRTDQHLPPNGPYVTSFGYSRLVAVQYTSDVGAEYTVRPIEGLVLRSAGGGQYLESHLNDSFAGHAQSVYVDEGVTIFDRLAIDAGGRWNHQWIHRAGIASTAIDPSLRGRLTVFGVDTTTHIQVHGAIGETHTIPTLEDLGRLRFSTVQICGPPGTVCFVPGPKFVAERQREAEGGVSAGLSNNRLTLDVTVFERRNVDVLEPGSVADSGGGIVRDDGLEVTVGARPIMTRAATWDVSFSAFVNQNKLLHTLEPSIASSSGLLVQRAGYPVYGIWRTPYTYADANHDGVIEPSEVTVASAPAYAGPARATREAALATTIALWHGRFTISALADYRGGYVLPDLASEYQAFVGTPRAINLPGASLADQAAAIAATMSPFYTGYVQRVNAIRWRELSISAPLVAGPASLRLTVAARNLALWTSYRGPDPDADVTTGNDAELRLPQPRTWLVRLSAEL